MTVNRYPLEYFKAEFGMEVGQHAEHMGRMVEKAPAFMVLERLMAREDAEDRMGKED